MLPISKQNKNVCATSKLDPTPTSQGLARVQVLLLLGTPLFALLAFSGVSSFWVQLPYDEWRLIQMVLLLLLGLYAIFSPRSLHSLWPQKPPLYLQAGLLAILVLVILSITQAAHPARAISDAALYTLLAASIWAQAKLLKQSPHWASPIAATLAIAPLLTVFFLLLSIATALSNHEITLWHQSFSNIRMFDDALLPCLFLLWQRPAWLGHQPNKSRRFNHAVTALVYAISTLYLMAFWMDGARAGLLAIVLGLGLLALIRRDQWLQLRLPICALIGSGLLYALLLQMLPPEFYNSVARTDSSLRNVLWLKAYELWQAHPLLGVGGDNFVYALPWVLNAHPHNLPLQLISEWGLAGLLVLVLLIPLSLRIIRHRQTLPAFAIAAVAAVAVDAMLSGVLVYPLSQMLGLWSVAWLISALPSQTLTKQSAAAKLSIRSHFKTWQLSFKIMTLCAVVALLCIHGLDLLCLDCTSVDQDNAPRFWQFGRALHLQKTDI